MMHRKDRVIEMDDLPKRLRMKADIMSTGEKIAWGSDTELMYKAAEYITVLEARNARLEEALENIKWHGVDQPAALGFSETEWAWRCFNRLQSIAKQALAENKE